MIKGSYLQSGTAAQEIELKDPTDGTFYSRSNLRLTRAEFIIQATGGVTGSYTDGILVLVRSEEAVSAWDYDDLIDDSEAKDNYPVGQFSVGANTTTKRNVIIRKKLNILIKGDDYLTLILDPGNSTVDVKVYYRIWHTVSNE